MEAQLDPKLGQIHIVRAQNGWSVRACETNQYGGSFAQVFVACTPSEVVELVREWAMGQAANPTVVER